MFSCPQCGRKAETAMPKCVCGFSFPQSAEMTAQLRDSRTEGAPPPAAVLFAGQSNSPDSKAGGPSESPQPKQSSIVWVPPPANAEAKPAEPTPPTPPAKTTGEDELVAEEAGPAKKELHEEEEVEDPNPVDAANPPGAGSLRVPPGAELKAPQSGAALHEEAEAEDLDHHEKLAVEEEAEDVEHPAPRRETAPKRNVSKLANLIGFGVNALLLLVVIWLVKVKLAPKDPNDMEPVTEVIQVPIKQESAAVMDPTNAPPPPAVAVQGDPQNPEGTPARTIEDAVRAQKLQCRIEAFKFNPADGALNVALCKDAFWDMKELRKAADHDVLLVLRSVFEKSQVKGVRLAVQARLEKTMGGGSFEKVLALTVNREAFEASGPPAAGDTTLPPSLQPQYHEKLTAK